MGGENQKIQAYGKTVRQERDEQIQKWRKIMEKRKSQLNISSRKQAKIVECHAYELAQMLNKGETTSREIITVLALRCTTAGFHYNLITEVDFDVADIAAQQCDEERKKSGKKNWTFKEKWDPQIFLPPFFGIPTSVKDFFDQKGKRSTLGVTVRAHDIKEKDCGIISCLRTGGIIPFVRSNVSQTTLNWDPVNHLYGRSKSVWGQDKSIGGSSGGEGALLSAFCTPLGLGTDIGGSVRIPAEFNGITSIKPSTQRFSTSKQYTTQFPDLLFGNDSIKSTFGPMARCVEDLSLWMKTTLDEHNHVDKDPYHRHIEFNIGDYLTHSTKKLKIGIIKSYSVLEASPASQRAVEQVALFLKKQGHQVVNVVYPLFEEIIGQFPVWKFAEGGFKGIDELLQGEQLTPALKKTKSMLKNRFVYNLSYYMTKFFMPRLHTTVKNIKPISTEQYFRHKSKIEKLQKSFIQWWKSLNLDHLITPGFGCQSCPTELCGGLAYAGIYTNVWNILNLPAGALPVTIVRSDQQHYESMHDDSLTKSLKKCAETSEGLPVGIQVIGMPFEEEKILSLMKSIECTFGFEKQRKIVSISNPE